jgi:hypothetical protein
MIGRFVAVFLISLGHAAIAADADADIPAFPSPSPAEPPAAATGYNLDTPIQTLATNPATAAVVDQNIPGLLEDENYSLFKRMSLKVVASLSGGRISTQTLQAIAVELKSVPISTASN